ncbi:MAG: carboxypeptidase-like regulatory domain-containing protein [Proteobacteria bacterium]|nr:carboxypeptidase-like regulatory domain-containing protein [Pseudomonadota bacterium]
MEVRSLVIAVVAAAVGWGARGGPATAGAPVALAAAASPAGPELRVHCPPLTARTAEGGAEIADADDDAEDGEDAGALIARAQAAVLILDRAHNAIRGTVTAAARGESLVGVTVIATSPSLPTQTAITDEQGAFDLTGLPAARYLVAFYYADVTVERADVIVSAVAATVVDVRLDEHPPTDLDVVDDDAIEGPTFDATYVVGIPTGRTFGTVLGTAADE